MFNVSTTRDLPGFRLDSLQIQPGFRVEVGGPPSYGFADAEGASSADGGVTPAYIPGPAGDGSGRGYDKCTLMPGISQFGFCLYLCPDGAVRRFEEIGPFGCRP